MIDDHGIDDLLEEGEVLVARILVARVISTDEDGDMRDLVLTDDGYGGELDMPTAVGMLAVAQHTMLCDHEGDE